MVVKQLKLIFNNKASCNNKDLTEFLKRNLNTIIVKGGIKFKYVIANMDELQALHKKGIKRLPALFPKKHKPLIGVPNIIKFLRRSVESSKQTAPPKSEAEILDEWNRKQLGNITKRGKQLVVPDDDDEENLDSSLMSKFNSELKRRQENMKGKDDRGNVTDIYSDPPGPRRDQDYDDDLTNRRGRSVINDTQRGGARMDNLDNEPGDPLAALNNIRGGRGGDMQDDSMMATLLERIGDSSPNF